MTRRVISRFWSALTTIPPIRPENLWPVLSMLIGWLALRRAGISEDQAFVSVVVSAEAYALWRNLPRAAAGLEAIGSARRSILSWPVAAMIVLAGVQLSLNDPLITQRILTAFGSLVALVMILGVFRERDMLERAVPESRVRGQDVERVSLLRVNAATAVMLVAANEALLAGGSLYAWMTMLPFLAVVLHAVYWFLVLLLMPPENTPA